MYVLAEEDFPSRFEDKILSAGKALWEAHRISGGKKIVDEITLNTFWGLRAEL